VSASIQVPQSAPLEFADQVDFTGGLNMSDEWFKLGQNETPECLNVVFDSMGGFRSRRGAVRLNTVGEASMPSSLWSYGDGSTYQMMAHVGTSLRYSTGGNFSAAGTLGTLSGPSFGATYSGIGYVARNAQDTTMSWNGTTLSALTDAHLGYDADYNSPSGTKAPRAKFVTSQHDRLWLGYTSEGGTDFPNRVRFSFVGDPASYLSTDYIDIDVGTTGGDEITAMVAVGDHVLVFKKHSVHMIMGYDQASFQVIDIRNGLGAVSQQGVTVGERGVFFFDHSEGLQLYVPPTQRGNDSDPFIDVFSKLRRLMRDDVIDDTTVAAEVQVGIVGDQVWLFLPNLSLAEDFTWVLETRTGAWTKFDLKVGPFLEWDDGSGDTLDVAVQRDGVSTEGLVKVAVDRTTDDLAGTLTNINCLWRSSWMTADTPTEYKRWKRPRIVASLTSGSAVTLNIELCQNYETDVISTINRTLSSATAGGVWETGVWDTMDWGASERSSKVDVFKGPTPGRARSICLRVSNDGENAADWSIQSLGTRWRRGVVRS
jgi:hypothetical protein